MGGMLYFVRSSSLSRVAEPGFCIVVVVIEPSSTNGEQPADILFGSVGPLAQGQQHPELVVRDLDFTQGGFKTTRPYGFLRGSTYIVSTESSK